MASVFAVVSKKVYESEARVSGKVLGLGGVWPTALYKSTHASLKPLAGGGHLFLVTVRPPNEALWLIALLRDVKGVPTGWKAVANSTPITDITKLKSKIRFATGTGITAEKGKLGMSLQTPRTLTDADVALLLSVCVPGATPPAAAEVAADVAEKIYHLNGHEKGPLPCLCAKCLANAGERVVVDGEAFVRREARAKSRVLYYWLPEVSLPSEKNVRFEIEQRMQKKLADVIDHAAGGGKRKGKRGGGDDDDDDGGDEDDE